MPRDARFWLPVPPWSGPDPVPPAAPFDPASGFPYQQAEDERWVADPNIADITTDTLYAFGPPLNAVVLTAFTLPQDAQLEGNPDDTLPAITFGTPAEKTTPFNIPDEAGPQTNPDDTLPAWAVQPPLNAVSKQAFSDDTGEQFAPPQFVPDDTPQAWSVTPPQNATQLGEFPQPSDDEVQASVVTDDSVQSYAVQPPAVAAFDPANGFPYQQAEDERFVADQTRQDDTPQAWSVGTPQNAVVLSAFTIDDEDAWQFVPTQDDTLPSLGRFPAELEFQQNEEDGERLVAPSFVPDDTPAPFVGVPQNVVLAQPVQPDPDFRLDVPVTDDTAQTYAIQPPVISTFDPATGFPWPQDGGEVQAQPGIDDSVQSWAVGSPQNVPQLSAFPGDSEVPPYTVTEDPTVPAWDITPPQNATQIVEFPQPSDDEVQAVPTDDPTVPAFAITPPPYIPVFALTAWAVEGGEVQFQPTDDPSVQAWAVGTPQNAALAQAFNIPDETLAQPTADDTTQSWAVQDTVGARAFNVPDEAPYSVVTDDTAQPYAVQPVAAAFDPSTVSHSTDDITQPVWWTADDTPQAWAIGPLPVLAAFNDPGFDIPAPWVVQPEQVSGVWTATLGAITPTFPAVFGPQAVAAAPAPSGSASAPGSMAESAAPAPSGEAAAPAPFSSASAPSPREQ